MRKANLQSTFSKMNFFKVIAIVLLVFICLASCAESGKIIEQGINQGSGENNSSTPPQGDNSQNTDSGNNNPSTPSQGDDSQNTDSGNNNPSTPSQGDNSQNTESGDNTSEEDKKPSGEPEIQPPTEGSDEPEQGKGDEGQTENPNEGDINEGDTIEDEKDPTLTHVFLNGMGDQNPVLNYNKQYLIYEDENTNWYDVKKFGGDSHLCWAATSAGMLHWWTANNRAHITEYMRINGIDENDSAYNTTYKYDGRNEGYGSSDDPKSAIFNKFKKSFTNLGGDIASSIYWYLIDAPRGDVAPLALFKDVFTKSDEIVKRSYVHGGKTEFENIVKTAIKNGYAVGMEYSYTSKQGQHAVNIWGYSQNKRGDIVALWITDSNLAIPYYTPMMNYGVMYKSNDNNIYLTNLSSASYGEEKGIFAKVIELVVLENGSELFEKYLNEHTSPSYSLN